jgi:hypothetical protein
MRVYIAVFALCLIAAVMTSEPHNSASLPKGNPQTQAHGNVTATQATEQHCKPCNDTAKTDGNTPKWYAPLKRAEWWLVILGFPTLFFIAWQAWETRKAGQTARNNTDAFIHSQRPWLALNVGIASPLIFDNEHSQMHLTFAVTVRNIGQMPAMGVWINPAIFLPSPTKQNVRDERKRICESLRPVTSAIGQTIFPGVDSGTHRMTVVLNMSEVWDACRGIFGDKAEEAKAFPAYVIVVAAYRTAIDKEAFFYTANTYELMRKEANHSLILKMQTTPLEDLQLFLYHDAGIMAE